MLSSSFQREIEVDLISSVESVQGKRKGSDKDMVLTAKQPEKQEAIIIQSETLETEHDGIAYALTNQSSV